MNCERKKIVHIISGLGDGGAEAALFRLCINDSSFDHFVVSLTLGGKYSDLFISQNVKLKQFNFTKFNFLVEFVKLVIFLKGLKFDLIQSWMYHANLIGGVAGRIAGYKRIFWGIHNSTLNFSKSKISTIFISYFSALLSYSLPHKVIYCARKSLDVHEGSLYCKSKSVVIYNGYDFSFFCPGDGAFKKEIGTVSIGMVARYDEYKDHPNLISALSLLKRSNCKFICYLAGSGIDTSNVELSDLISKHGLTDNIKLLGRRDDIHLIYKSLDINVLSSSAEAFPNVLCEAMSSEVPCISTDVGDARYIVDNTGWIVPIGDSLSLFLALKSAIREINFEHKKFMDRRKLARKRVVDNFSLNRMIVNYNRIWSGELD